MLVIRLARTGRKKSASYRIVAAEKTRAVTGKFVEVLGHYNPHTKELVLNKERLETRVSQGAQPSNTVLRLMQNEGMDLPKWAKISKKQRAPKKEPEVQEEALEDNVKTQEEAPEDSTKTQTTASDDASSKEADPKTTE